VSRRSGGAIVGVMLTSTACLVEPNPEFMASAGETGAMETSPTDCPAGTLDCDGEPGCEADADDPLNCGSCDNVCEFGGEMLSCVAEQCTGTVVFTDLPDAYVDSAAPDQNFGSSPLLLVNTTQTSYIELPDIDAIPSTATIETLALHLTCIPESGASVDVFRIETSWDEQQLTGDNAPSFDQSLISSLDLVIGQNVIDLVGLLPSWRMGNPKRSLAFGPDPNAGPAAVECSSREGTAPPFLLLTMSW
jgi:hypothetical protein